MAQGWQRVWTDEQKEAVATAFMDRGIRPRRKIAELAKAGDLEFNGSKLEPFDMPLNTIGACVDQLKKRRAGLVAGQLGDRPDAVAILRRRLLNAADSELRAWERGKVGKRDLERHRQIARAVREAAAIPPQGTAPRPGAHIPGEGRLNGGQTTGGLAHDILKSHRAGQTAHDVHTEHTQRDNAGVQGTERAAHEGTSERAEQHTIGPVPGSRAAEQVGEVGQQSA